MRLFILVAINAYVISSCSPDSSKKNTIIIGILKHESTLPFYVAEELGYFKKHNIDAELVDLPPADHMNALLSNRVDILSCTNLY